MSIINKEKQEAIEAGNKIAREAIERIAQSEGLPYSSVYEEMKICINAAMQTKRSLKHFKRMRIATGHQIPTPEDFIIYCSAIAVNDPDPDFAKVLDFLKLKKN